MRKPQQLLFIFLNMVTIAWPIALKRVVRCVFEVQIMALSRLVFVLPVAVLLSACVSSEPASRSTVDPATTATRSGGRGPVVLASTYDVVGISVNVPQTLRVSEANSFHPNADIVWHGDPYGDRYQQVASIFRDAATAATGPMHQGRRVNVGIEVIRFHGVTDKTRYTIGGTHSMHFILTVTDAATGQVLDGPRRVLADVKAAGGNAAVAEDRAGRTQRVVVTDHLTQVLRRELSTVVTDPEVIGRALMAVSPTAPETAG